MISCSCPLRRNVLENKASDLAKSRLYPALLVFLIRCAFCLIDDNDDDYYDDDSLGLCEDSIVS